MMERGIFYNLIDAVVFLVCGYAIHIGLGRYLGAAQYGIFGVIISLSTMTYVFFNYGIRSTITKFISEDKRFALPILRAGIKLQAFFGVSIALLLLVFADLVAGLLDDITLAPYIRLSALAVVPLSLYEVYLGLLNGKKEFGRNAVTSIIYSLAKVLSIFILVVIGYGVKGAILGYFIASVLGLFVGKKVSTYENKDGVFSQIKILKFALPLVIFSISASLLMNLDILFVKSLLKDNKLTGLYAAASNLSRTLWFLSSAFTGVILPLVSNSSVTGNSEEIRIYIKRGIRYTLMLLLPISVLLSATAEGFVELLYSSEFKMAGDAFRFLIFGFLFFSIFSVICTIITAIGHPGLSLGFALAMVPFNIIANIVLIPIYEIVGAAVATSLVFLVGLLFAGAYLFKRFGVFMDIKSFLRISIGSSVLYFVASRLDITGVELIAGYVCLAALYFILLILTKELNRDDLKIVKQTAGSLLNFKTLKCY